MEMNMLGWSSEAGNPNIQDLKENWQKRSGRSLPPGEDVFLERIVIQPAGAADITEKKKGVALLQAGNFRAAMKKRTFNGLVYFPDRSHHACRYDLTDSWRMLWSIAVSGTIR